MAGYLEDLWNKKYFDPYSFDPSNYVPYATPYGDISGEGNAPAGYNTQYYIPKDYSGLAQVGAGLTGSGLNNIPASFLGGSRVGEGIWGGQGGGNPTTSGLIYSSPGYTMADVLRGSADMWGNAQPAAKALTPSEYQTLSDMYRLGLLKNPTPTETSVAPTPSANVGTGEGGTDLTIPENLFPFNVSSSYKGLGTSEAAASQLPYFEALAGLQNYLRPGGAQKLFEETRGGLLGSFRPAYEQKISESLAPLAEKGMLGGTSQENILKGVTADLARTYDTQALTNVEQKVTTFLNSIGGLGNLLAYTESQSVEADPLAPYKLFAQMASGWLGS